MKYPGCSKAYEDWFRPSINLQLDDFDEGEVEESWGILDNPPRGELRWMICFPTCSW